jgi:predicted PurR-regulated permease PerM
MIQPDAPQDFPRWSPRQIVLATLSVAGVFLVFWLFYLYRAPIFLLFIGIVLGTAIQPLVSWLGRLGLTRGSGLLLANGVLLLLVFGFLYLTIPTVITQLIGLSGDVPRYYLEFRSVLLESPSRLVRIVGSGLPASIQLIMQSSSEPGQTMDVVASFIGYANLIVRGVLSILGVFLIASLWILDGGRTQKSLLILFPPAKREKIQEVATAIEQKVGSYIRVQLILAVSIGLLALVAYLLIGLPNAFTLAIFAGLFEVVPIIGPLLGAIPAILVAFSIHPDLVLWVILATLIIQALENFFLVPRITNTAVGVNPIVTLLALFAFSSLLGLPGALLAIPCAAIFQLLLDRFIFSAGATANNITDGRDYLSWLRYEAQDLVLDVRKQLRKKSDPTNDLNDEIEESVERIAGQLDLILEQLSREETRP